MSNIRIQKLFVIFFYLTHTETVKNECVKTFLDTFFWVPSMKKICKLQKGCTRLAAASDKVYQLLAQGRWFSPGTPASSTTKTGRHDIAEILLKVALNTKIQIQIRSLFVFFSVDNCIAVYMIHPLTFC